MTNPVVLPGSLVAGRQVPSYRIESFRPRANRWCIGIPVINEGDRLLGQLKRMQALGLRADVIIADGGSKDGSVQHTVLEPLGVRTMLTKLGPGKLSAQMRMVFDYMLNEGYEGIVLIDGNGKDGVEAIPSFLTALEQGWDYLQGSRYLAGGHHENTPLDRKLGGRLIHAPLLSLAARFYYTDTTNGFRGISSRLLLDPRLQPFRDIFDTYNLHYYLSIRAPRLGYRVRELPVSRSYPPAGPTPSKIGGFSGKFAIFQLLLEAVMGKYDPPQGHHG